MGSEMCIRDRIGADEVIDLGRPFQLELFKSPQSRLLLRSPRYPGGYPDRVDLMFLNTEYIAIRDLLPDMTVTRVQPGSPEDLELIHTAQALRHAGSPSIVFRVDCFSEGELLRGHVIASSLWIARDTLGEDAPSRLIEDSK